MSLSFIVIIFVFSFSCTGRKSEIINVKGETKASYEKPCMNHTFIKFTKFMMYAKICDISQKFVYKNEICRFIKIFQLSIAVKKVDRYVF